MTDLLTTTEMAIIDILDEEGPSSIEELANHTFCKPEEIQPNINRLVRENLIQLRDDGSYQFKKRGLYD